jgi:hypothetical protein
LAPTPKERRTARRWTPATEKGVSGRPIMAWAFETVGVTPSIVKGSAVKSNAVAMRSFFFMSLLHHCDLDPLVVFNTSA